MTKRRIYCNIFQRETGKMVVSDELPNEDYYYQYELNKDKYDICCSTCGGKGRIVARRHASDNRIIDYYIRGNHTDDCIVASDGCIQKIKTGEIVLSFFDGTYIEKNETIQTEKNERNVFNQKTATKSGVEYVNENQYYRKMRKPYFDALYSLEPNDSVFVSEDVGNVKKRWGDVVIAKKTGEMYSQQKLNGQKFIIGCQNVTRYQDSEHDCVIYLGLPKQQKDFQVVLILHFPNVDEWRKFKLKKDEYIEATKKREEAYKSHLKTGESYTIKRDIPVIACNLKYSKKSFGEIKGKAYDADISEKNYVWIDDSFLNEKNKK